MTNEFADNDEITEYIAQLPSAKLEADQAYARGTIMTLTVQVRVKNAFTDEDRKGKLFVRHNLVIEDVAISDVLTPEQRKALLDAAEAEVKEPTLEDALIQERDELVNEATIEFVDGPTVEPEVREAVYTRPQGEEYQQQAREAAANGEVVALMAQEETDTRPFDFVATNQDKGLASDDDDDHEHDWMDEEVETGLTVDLREVVGL